MKNFLIRSMMGIFFGSFLSIIMTYTVVLSGQETLDSGLFMKNSLGTILCGWFFTASTLYFEKYTWTLRRQTAMHFVTVTILYFILAFGIGWFPFTVPSFLLMLAVFLIFYTLFWTAFYLYFKNQAKKMNAELKNE